MLTFYDPILGCCRGVRGVAWARSREPRPTAPAETYPVIDDLLGAARSVQQVLDQLADTHPDFRACARDDAGNHQVGAGEVLAAADELHQAGTLLDQVGSRLHRAAQHSGRVVWHEVPHATSLTKARSASRRSVFSDLFSHDYPRPDWGGRGASL